MIEFHAVSKTYAVAGQDIPALHPFDLRIERGEIFGIIGHSGAGKSTLIRLINGIERASGGHLLVDGEDVTRLDGASLRGLRRRVGMIFQHFNLLTAKTVAANVAFPLQLAGTWSATQITARVHELLQRVDLTDHADKFPAQLSGGQKQRVGIARALACAPSVLLCDEATSALDPQTTTSVLRLLAQINRELGLTIVLITHEMDVVRQVCDRVAVLDAGRVVEVGSVADVFLHPEHATTQRFVRESGHIDANDQFEDLSRAAGRVVRLTFRGSSTYEPLLGAVARDSGIDFSILAGRIDRIKDTPYGQLMLALNHGDIDAALQQFADHGVHVEVLR